MNIIRYTLCLITFVPFLLLFSFNGNSDATPLEEEKEALKVILDFANQICDEITLEGEGENLELSGEAKAELDWLLKKLANLGIKGAATYQKAEYEGVLREDLAEVLKDSRDCKLEIFNQLKSIFFEDHSHPDLSDRISDDKSMVGPTKFEGFRELDISLSPQRSPRWGWAASIGAILRYKGIDISEEEIVVRTAMSTEMPPSYPIHSFFSGVYGEFELLLERVPFPRIATIVELIKKDEPFLIEKQGRVYVFLGLHIVTVKQGDTYLKDVILGDTMGYINKKIVVTSSEIAGSYMLRVTILKR